MWGKSTFLKLLAGTINPDSGKQTSVKGSRVLLVEQELPEDGTTPLEYLRNKNPEIQELQEALDHANNEEFGLLMSQLTELEDERYETLALQVLMGLGLNEEQLAQPMKNLSGGLRMRISIAQALIRKPDVLLLDEPTNHLDLEATQWLISYLKNYPSECAVVIFPMIFLYFSKLLAQQCM